MKKFLIYISIFTIIIFSAGYFSLSNITVKKFVLARIFESRFETAFAISENVNFDELEIFFCGSGSPLSFSPEGAQCIALIVGNDIYVIDSGENSFG